ncbi:hypothetical protein JX265_006502 [Neoarthrinium moseri]|uniref:BPL/LPL catalytic domain-containing protein n=1 Tax=Neoarthrinium moseri TaxID=1658444 RepID=A0A9P9WL79_9PEZI|nr:hypothetical protein JX265_006502 [Neoarthrinium moseri]
MPLLRHIRIPPVPSTGKSVAPRYPTYAHVDSIQSKLQARLLDYKASLSSEHPKPAPAPSILSFTPAPTYTLGRRQTQPLSAEQERRLRAPLHVQHPVLNSRDGHDKYSAGEGSQSRSFAPEVTNTPRGGLATYHGPGQVVFWPVIDLHSPLHRHFTVRDYACLLEKTTIAALARATEVFSPQGVTVLRDAEKTVIRGFTTKENPGVWVNSHPAQGPEHERKIAALGVQLRRHVTSLGVAVNISMPVSGPELTNPWGRIVACGIEDKGVTSVMDELYGEHWRSTVKKSAAEKEKELYLRIAEVLRRQLEVVWVEEFTKRLELKTDSTSTNQSRQVEEYLPKDGPDSGWLSGERNDELV